MTTILTGDRMTLRSIQQADYPIMWQLIYGDPNPEWKLSSKWLEVGIVIYKSAYWSSGYGTEALRLWISHLFQTMPLVRVGLTTWSGNERMVRTAEKLGMLMEGRMRKCRFYNGHYYDSIRMGVLREEWVF